MKGAYKAGHPLPALSETEKVGDYDEEESLGNEYNNGSAVPKDKKLSGDCLIR